MAIFEKPMIQIHGKTILSMEFKPIIKAHDSNSWQFIHPKPNSHWQHQTPILIDNIKVQFLLATSKPNSHWQHQKPNFHWYYFIKKKRVQDYQRLAKKKKIMLKCYCGKKWSWQSSYEETHWELSCGLCSHIMNPWNTWTSFCITTSIIYTFYTHGKTFKHTSSSSKLLETMNIAICNSS